MTTAVTYTTNVTTGVVTRTPTYQNVQGTSFSAPMVTGVMALLQARAKSALGRFMTPAELKWVVNSTVAQTPDLFNQLGTGGKLNASAAMGWLNDVIAKRINFPGTPPPSAPPPTSSPPQAPKKGKASCQIVLFSWRNYRGPAFKARVDWFNTTVRRTFVSPRLDMVDGQRFVNRTRSFAVLCDCDEVGFDCNSQARAMQITFYTSPLRDATSAPVPAYTWNFAVRTSPRCQPSFCDIMYKQLPPQLTDRITGFRFVFNPPVLPNSPANEAMLRVNKATTSVTGGPDVSVNSPSYNAVWLRKVAGSAIPAKPGTFPQSRVEVPNVPSMPSVTTKTKVWK